MGRRVKNATEREREEARQDEMMSHAHSSLPSPGANGGTNNHQHVALIASTYSPTPR